MTVFGSVACLLTAEVLDSGFIQFCDVIHPEGASYASAEFTLVCHLGSLPDISSGHRQKDVLTYCNCYMGCEGGEEGQRMGWAEMIQTSRIRNLLGAMISLIEETN